MQSVSEAFKAAAAATTRQPLARLTCYFLDNSLLTGYLGADAGEKEAFVTVGNLINGARAATKAWALARDDCYPGDSLYPCDELREIGWFSDQTSDGSGNVSPAEVVTLTFATAQRISEVRWWGDVWLGYLVDFAIYYWEIEAAGWVEIVDVTGHASASYAYALPTAVTTTRLKLEIGKISRASSHVALLEFQGGLVADLTPHVVSFDILQERAFSQEGSVPIGNYAAGELNLTLDNTDDRFCMRNAAGPYYGYLRPNRRIEVELGFVTASGDEYCDAGVFYARKWEARSGEPHAYVVARDGVKGLQAVQFSAAVYENYTISQLVAELAAAGGITNPELLATDETTYPVPYAIFEQGSVWDHLKALAIGESGYVHFDASGRLVFENRDHLASKTSVLATLTDNDCVVALRDWVDEAAIRNTIRVRSTRYTEGSDQTVWSLQETITVPGSDDWWDSAWSKRRYISITPDASYGLTAGDTVRVEISGSTAAAIYAATQSDGGDLRVVHDNGSGTYTQKDRWIEKLSPSLIILYFPVHENISGGVTNTAHYLYYDNPGAGDPPADKDNIFLLWDDFDRASLGSNWGEYGAFSDWTIDEWWHLRCQYLGLYDANCIWEASQSVSNWEMGMWSRNQWPDDYEGFMVGPSCHTTKQAEKRGGYCYTDYSPTYNHYFLRTYIQTDNGGTEGAYDESEEWDSRDLHWWRLTKQGTTWKLYVDHELRVTRSGDSWAPTYFGIYSYNDPCQFDAWWVRSIKQVEPAITVSGIENKPTILGQDNTAIVNVEFSAPCVDIGAPVITDGDAGISISSYSLNCKGGAIELVNTGAEGQVRGMAINAKPLSEAGTTVAGASDGPSVGEFGALAYEVDSDFIQSYAHALDIATAMLAALKDPDREIEVTMTTAGLPHLELGDRVHVQNAVTGVDADFHVVRIRTGYDGSIGQELTLLKATS